MFSSDDHFDGPPPADAMFEQFLADEEEFLGLNQPENGRRTSADFLRVGLQFYEYLKRP